MPYKDPERQRQFQREWYRKKAEDPEWLEKKRRIAKGVIIRKWAAGVCYDCPNPAILGQVYCWDCADKQKGL